MRRIILLAGFAAVTTCLCFAEEERAASVESSFDIHLRLGYRYSEWGPGFRQDIIKFETEGLETIDAGLLLQFKNFPVAFYRYEGPYDSSPSQNELFKKNVSQSSALREIQLGFLFEWVEALTSGDSSWTVALSRLRFIHTEQTFFGEAVAVEPFAYASLGIDIIEDYDDDGSVWFEGLQDIDEGESVAFRTEFVDDEVSVLWPMELWGIPFNVRAGWYKSKWLRPSDIDRSWRLVEDRKRILYETEFRSSGLVLGIEPKSRDIPGPNLRLTGHWGFDDDVRNRVNSDFEIEEGKELQYASGVIDWWFNWVPSDRLLLQLGASWDRRVFGTEISLTGGMVEDEDLYSAYAKLRFSL